MADQALYRRWRSQTFAEVVGQEHVTTTLKNAVAGGRTIHAYLFYGPRGTGKTSTGRILAKALNCEKNRNGEPCNVCPQCLAVTEGRSLDLVEIDAASNRGIDDIRDLRDKVNYAPSLGQYRVYIIDEVHMLTTEASNALLKTLEEPPAHTKFVLATTEVHRILPTILSRCQQFQFRPISQAAARERLALICKEEGIAVENGVLEFLARAGSGSLRDAINVLDQLTAHFGASLMLSDVQSLLGRSEDERAILLAEQIFLGDVAGALETINSVAWDGGDLRQFAKNLLATLRMTMLHKAGAHVVIDVTAETRSRIEALAEMVTMSQLLAIIKRFAQADLRTDEESILQLELAAVESALLATGTPAEHDEVAAPATSRKSAGKVEAATPPAKPDDRVIITRELGERATETPKAGDEPVADLAERAAITPEALNLEGLAPGDLFEQLTANWASVLVGLRNVNKNIEAMLRGSCELMAIENDAVTIGFYHAFHKDKIEDPRNRRVLEDMLSKILGKRYEVRCTLTTRDAKAKIKAMRSDPVIKAALEMGGRIVEEP